MLAAPLHAGKAYKVYFHNDESSTGTVLLIIGWVPKHQHAVPSPQHAVIAPGASAELTGVVPAYADARRLTVVAALDHGEVGRLQVFENEAIRKSADLTHTITWEHPVDP